MILAIRKCYLPILAGPKMFSQFSTTLQMEKHKDADSTTFDNLEAIKYSKLTAEWWNLNGPIKVLHAMNPVRLKFIMDGVTNTRLKGTNPQKPLEGLKLLDVGCGGGILTESLGKYGAQVTAIDASKDLLTIAKEHAAANASLRENLEYRNILVEDLVKEEKECYDVVVASEVIEHVHDQTFFLESCTQALKPGGSIFITTLNKNFKSWLVAIILFEYVLRQIPLGIHDWHKFITPDDVKQLLEKYNCHTKLVQGIFYNPVTSKCSLSSSAHIFYALHAVKEEN